MGRDFAGWFRSLALGHVASRVRLFDMKALKITLLSFVCLVLGSAAASADVPPPPGYVETCTIEKQCKKTEAGDLCSAWHGERDKCSKLHAKTGFVFKCKTRGASVWSEVWCGPKGSNPTNPKKAP